MKKYRIYIYGVFILIAGVMVGWFLKPTGTAEMNNQVDNTMHDHKNDEVWTCSMHPQIRQNEPGICPICEMDLIPLSNNLGSDDPTVLMMTEGAVKLAQIETVTVGENEKAKNSNNQTIKVDGIVELDERTIKSQTAHISGRIESMNVNFENQYIKKGQVIATIYSTDLLAATQELITAAKFNDRVEGLKEASIQKLKNWKISDSQIQQILQDGQPIKTIKIYADHSGYVMNKKLSPGDYVKQGQSLYTLGSTSNVWLVFNVFESDLLNIKKGNEVTFSIPANPNKQYKAKIVYIDPILNPATRTAVVRAEIRNPNNIFKPGMLLNGEISIKTETMGEELQEKISIPNSAVMWTGNKSIVYVQDPESEVPSFQFREVTVENRSARFSTISSGLKPGDVVVKEGAFAIDAAAQLNNNFSMMNRDVKIKNDVSQDVVPNFVDATPPKFKDQLDNALNKYIGLKNKLVLTDAKSASLESELLLQSVAKIDMTLLKGEAHIFWMDQLRAINAHAENIKNSEDVEEQRNQFDFLSQAVIKSLKAFGTNGNTYFIQYCPMVKDNQGADWISKEKEIKNPYFGDKMMKCGSVKLELK